MQVRLRLQGGTLVLLSLFLGRTAVYAQTETAVPELVAPAVGKAERAVRKPLPDPGSIYNLSTGLEHIVWNIARRGPLIALQPENVNPFMAEWEPGEPQIPPQLPPADQQSGWNVDIMANHFGRKVFRCGSVSVLAPKEMVVIAKALPTPDPLAGIRSYERIQMFSASLTESQWRQMASPQGIGVNDLTPEQQKIFLSLVPEKSRVSKVRQKDRYAEGIPFDDVPEDADHSRRYERPILEGQRRGMRVRINRKTRLWLPEANSGNYYGAWVPEHPENTEYYQLNIHGEWSNKPEAFGIKLADKVPTKPKPGHLGYDAPALNFGVYLKKVKTLGDAIKQIAQTSRLELYADSRLVPLSLWSNAEENTVVHAGDLLKAIALTVNGTYRKVGPAYVLTADLEGLAAQRARVSEWGLHAQQKRQLLTMEWNRKLAKAKPGSFIRFAPDDSLALPTALQERIEKNFSQSRLRYRPEMVSVRELPDALQRQVEMAISAHEEQARHNPNQRPVVTDKVNITLETSLTLQIPGVGEVAAPFSLGMQQLLGTPPDTDTRGKILDRPIVLPDVALGGALLVTPETVEQAPQIVNLAQQKGFRHIWVQLPFNPTDGTALLEAVIAAARPANLPVNAVVRLMRTEPPAESKPSSVLINVRGENPVQWAKRQQQNAEEGSDLFPRQRLLSDWLDPTAPDTVSKLKERLLGVAAIPGVSGIVLRDIAVPGFDRSGKPGTSEYFNGQASDFGYSEEMRLEMLRQHGCDPIDLVSNAVYFDGGNIQIPFFPDQQVNYIQQGNGEWVPDPNSITASMRWNQMRFAFTEKLLPELHRQLTVAKPGIKFFISSLNARWDGWFATWDSPEMALADPGRYNSPGGSPTAMAERSLINISLPLMTAQRHWMQEEKAGDESRQLMRSLNMYFESDAIRNQSWDGVVLDISDMTVNEALPLISAAFAPAH